MTKLMNAGTARLILITNMIFGYRKIEHIKNEDITDEALRANVEEDMKIVLECAATKDIEKLNAHFKDDIVLLAALDDSVAMWEGMAALGIINPDLLESEDPNHKNDVGMFG